MQVRKKAIIMVMATVTLLLNSPQLLASETTAVSKPVKCFGINSCRAKGQCGGKGKNACAGLNACKGQSWLYVPVKDCVKRKGIILK